jgi:hypothetical protein
MPAERDWFGTPIFILNFNQVSHLRRQVAWLLRAGYRNLTVLDNHSTYPPLLRYYEEMTSRSEIAVVRRSSNESKSTVWDEHLRELDEPFVLTTSDVVPDECCPADVVARLASHLRESPQLYKAGLGLRIDDLPDCYMHRDKVIVKQSEYWRIPAAPGLFLAPIDFTFALYRRGGRFGWAPAVRTGWPCLARHEPWYSDSANRTEEEAYYEATIAPGRGSWGRVRLPDWLLETCDRLSSEPSRTLVHLASGRDTFPGWINVDADPASGAELTFDLRRCGSERLPLNDDSVDGFFLGAAIDGAGPTSAMLGELYRAARPMARFVLRLRQPRGPQTDSSTAFRPDSFDAWAQPSPAGLATGYAADWQVERIRLVVDGNAAELASPAAIAASMATGSDVVRELVVHLRAIKPARAEASRSFATPVVDIGASPVDEASAF